MRDFAEFEIEFCPRRDNGCESPHGPFIRPCGLSVNSASIGMKVGRVIICSLLAGLALAGARRVEAQPFTNAVYTLLDGSSIVDDCLICGRPAILQQLRGTFELALLEENPLFSRYRLTNIVWHAGSGAPFSYDIMGSGEYRFGGEVALVQNMTLEVQVNGQKRIFTNDSPSIDRRFPLIDVSLTQTQLNLFQFYTLRLVAAPVREIWFSTTGGFTSASNNVHGGPGDLLSASGRFVKTYASLVAALGLPTGETSLGIDAVEIGPGGEVFFSFDQNQTSPVLGLILQGDLVSNRGRMVHRNQALISEFGVMPPVPDLGLDAVHVKDDGEVLFSIRTGMFSERLGMKLERGDLLSNRGAIVARNALLLARFHPTTSKDFGLDALYVWPNGEVWFSTEEGFQDQEFGPVGAGDLLSDQGLIVFRNLELMSAFAPIEDVSSFGLDALFIVTDVTPPAPPPRFTGISRGTRSTSLHWQGAGKVFQVFKSTQVNSPFTPVSVLLPDQTFGDVDSGGQAGAGFYWLRQW